MRPVTCTRIKFASFCARHSIAAPRCIPWWLRNGRCLCVMLPLSMEKTADDPCPLYHYLVVESRDPVRFPEGVGLDITRLRSVPPALSKRCHLRLKDDCGSRIFLDIRAPHGVQKRSFTSPD